MSHIFMSYSHDDEAYVKCLVSELHRRGFDVWYDKHIRYGDTWQIAIFKSIEDCSAVVVVMTLTAFESNFVRAELIHANTEKKPIYSLLRSGDPFPQLAYLQWVDVTKGQLPPDSFFDALPISARNSGTDESDLPPAKKCRILRWFICLPLWVRIVIMAIVAAVVALLLALTAAFITPGGGDPTPTQIPPVASPTIINTAPVTPSPTIEPSSPPTPTLMPLTVTIPRPTCSPTPQPSLTPLPTLTPSGVVEQTRAAALLAQTPSPTPTNAALYQIQQSLTATAAAISGCS